MIYEQKKTTYLFEMKIVLLMPFFVYTFKNFLAENVKSAVRL